MRDTGKKTIELFWYDPGETILYFRFGRTWLWEEFFEADAESNRLASGKDYVVDTIFDFTVTVTVPDKLLTNFLRAAKGSDEHPNHGITVIFGVGILFRVMGGSIQKLVRSEHIQIADDIDQALAIIATAQAKRKP
jgi:hypothetical protein